MTTLQKTSLTAMIATVSATGIFVAFRHADLRGQIETLQQQQALLGQQLEQMGQDRDEAAGRFAALQQENAELRHALGELPGLRGEIARLRTRSQTLAESKPTASAISADPALEGTLKPWAARAATLKQK